MEDEAALEAAFLKSISHLPSEMQDLINKLRLIHTPYFHIVQNDTGVQANMPSPDRLAIDGAKELYSCHLNVNFTKFFAGTNFAGRCNKGGSGYDVRELATLPTLKQRCERLKIDFYSPNTFQSTLKYAEDALVRDSKGRMVPRVAGECVPVNELLPGHFARSYLENRKGGPYDLDRLVYQFNASYCFQELADDNVYYARLPHGFRKTPQGRIVFHMWDGDLFQGWQARIIELESEDSRFRYYYHPYTFQWFPYQMRQGGEWVPYVTAHPTIDMTNFKMSKYTIGAGTKSRASLMGLAAAIAHPSNTVFIVEGVLDAGRIGPPAVSVQGKGIGVGQMDLLTNARRDGFPAFTNYCVIADNDEGGKELQKNVEQMFGTRSICVNSITIPGRFNDVGEMPQAEVDEMIRPYLI